LVPGDRHGAPYRPYGSDIDHGREVVVIDDEVATDGGERRENDRVAVREVLDDEIALDAGECGQSGVVAVGDHYIRVGWRRDERLPVRAVLGDAGVRDVGLAGAIDVDLEDVVVESVDRLFEVGGEDDPLAIRRPRGVHVGEDGVAVRGDGGRAGPVLVDAPDLVGGHAGRGSVEDVLVRDLLSIRRPCR
jgi:hypothetical protein